MEKITDGNDPIVTTVYRQTGENNYRPATEKEIKEGIYLVHKEGLTKREHFAAMAMQGLVASQSHEYNYQTEKILAEQAVKYADALITQLNTPTP